MLHLIARRLSDKGVTIVAHLLFGVLGLWLVQRLFFYEQTEKTAILNTQGLTGLWVIGVASVVSILSTSFKQRQVYLLSCPYSYLGMVPEGAIPVVAWTRLCHDCLGSSYNHLARSRAPFEFQPANNRRHGNFAHCCRQAILG